MIAFPPSTMPPAMPPAAAAKKQKPIGIIIHYYDKIGVGVIRLDGTLEVGDTIKIQRGDLECTQTVESMQMEHENVDKAGKGQEVGMKLNVKTKEGALVFKE